MQPLAAQLRPKNLDEFIGQEHLVGNNKPLRKVIENKQIFSMIFWGPPGVGKTTLAKIIARENGRDFYELSAVSAGKKDVREIIQQAEAKQQDLLSSYQAPILFLDEIHRFNKAQQDYLLPYVETGTLILIGATTENPSFEVIAALLSRTRVFVLKKLSEEDLSNIIKNTKQKVGKKAQNWLVKYANGDARKLLTILDNTLLLYGDLKLESLKNTLQSQHLNYDKKGEEHYDTISAFIKSMRASNIDAALYYLARMVHGGEDPKFIARRMVIFASEDIGLAQPTALVVANAVFEAVTKVGYPEAQINLAHGVAYLAKCKKNRSAYDAYFKALRDVESLGNLAIPLELRNAPTKLMKELNYGKDYEMYPDQKKSLLPDKLKNKKYLK
jgi:putative ATPase